MVIAKIQYHEANGSAFVVVVDVEISRPATFLVRLNIINLELENARSLPAKRALLDQA